MKPNYKGLIWTSHAIYRMRERGIKQLDAYLTWHNPEKSKYIRSKSVWVYFQNLGGRKIEVAARKNEKGQWLILSVWEKNCLSGKARNKKRSGLGDLLARFFKR